MIFPQKDRYMCDYVDILKNVGVHDRDCDCGRVRGHDDDFG